MRYVVYILQSLKDKKLYIGQTRDLYKRLHLHFNGLVQATHNRRPLKLIYKETYPTRSQAFIRERFLKSLWAGGFKKKLLNSKNVKNLNF